MLVVSVIRWDQKMKFDLKPGNLFDWVIEYNNKRVRLDEELWSSLMNRWIPIGGPEPMLCIGITDEGIVWLSVKGLFSASIKDGGEGWLMSSRWRVVPLVFVK